MRPTEPPNASPSTALRLAAFAVAALTLGLPINTLAAFAAFVLIVLIALTGLITKRITRWLAAIAVAAAVIGAHALFPAPRIEEGHNAFLIDKDGGTLERGLPREAFRVMAQQFNATYPPGRRCREGALDCWGALGLTNDTYALAADGMLDRPAYSRRVTGIDLDSPIWLRLGVINDLSLNFIGKPGELERLQRDRRSLAIFGRWRLMLPWFVMYRFPVDFVGSRFCWRGEVLWEGAGETFAHFDNDDFGCRVLQAADVGRRIYGIAIADSDLAIALEANTHVTIRRAFEHLVTALGVGTVLLLLIAQWRPRRATFPVWCGALALITVIAIDATFVGGYRPFDGGDDGLFFVGFARVMLDALRHGDLMGVLRGAEDVYAFTAGMRYFRFGELLAFGDSFLGYLLLMLALPLLVYRLFRRFVGIDWALAVTLLFLTPAGVLFGTSHLHFATWAARGYADPLAAMALFAGLVVLAGPTGRSVETGLSRTFFGALLMACAVVLRPNLVLGAAVILAGVGLAALWRRRFGQFAALCIGFLPVLFPLWHNWHFGHVIVLFSDILTNANIYMVPPVTYLNALGEIARLDLTGENLGRIARQLWLFLSGPSQLGIMVPLHTAALAILIRVALARRFEPMLRLTALATLALIPPALVYVITVRYHLAHWLLTALVVAAWLQRDGLAWIDTHWPDLRTRLVHNAIVAWIGRRLMQLRTSGELDSDPA